MASRTAAPRRKPAPKKKAPARRPPAKPVLEQRHYDLVAVGYGAYPAECTLPGSESDDNAFARQAGYRLVASSSYMNVYRVR